MLGLRDNRTIAHQLCTTLGSYQVAMIGSKITLVRCNWCVTATRGISWDGNMAE